MTETPEATIARLQRELAEARGREMEWAGIRDELVAERDTARAETGRVVEACATAIETLEPGSLDGSEPQRYSDETKFALMVAATLIRALAVRMSPHVTAASDARDRAMMAKGARMAAAHHDSMASDEDALSAKYRSGSNPWFAHVQMAKWHREHSTAITALADRIEAGEVEG